MEEDKDLTAEEHGVLVSCSFSVKLQDVKPHGFSSFLCGKNLGKFPACVKGKHYGR
jgi:hypothetical protein